MKKLILGLVSLLMLVGCKQEKGERENMSPEPYVMATHCIGRNTISIPRHFVESPVTTGIFRTVGLKPQDPAFEIVVRRGRFTRDQFSAEVQKRRLEMKRGGGDHSKVLRLDTTLADGSVLLRLQEIEDAYVSEISFLRGENMTTVKLESYHDQYLKAEESLIKFAAGVKERNQNERSAGFCLGGVNISGSFETEHGSFWFRDGRGSDFVVDIDTYTPDDKIPLLTRMSGPDSLLAAFDVRHKVLRTGERIVAGMHAQEWLGWAKISDDPDAKTLKFVMDTMRPKPSREAPGISLTFNTATALEDGTPTKTLLSDDEAMQLWDSVVDSIRPAGS